MKHEVSLKKAKWLVEPGCVILVTSKRNEDLNIITMSWQVPLENYDPCLVAIVIRPTRYSFELIKETDEFVINIPNVELAKEIHFCGTVSGRDVNKFQETGLTPISAELVKPPCIEECIGHLECKVAGTHTWRIHTIIVGEVIRAAASAHLFDGHWKTEKAKTLHYLGGSLYGVLERTIDVSKL